MPEPQADAAALARGGAAGAAAAASGSGSGSRRCRRSGWLAAERPDQVWALDFQFDQTADGRILKLLHVVDEYTREALAIECARRIDADATVRVLDRLVAARGRPPEHIRCDNGPELTANVLRDWCRFNQAGSAYIEPGSPWQYPYVESFGSRIRDELLAVELFDSLAEAKLLVEDWRIDYNTNRPHSDARDDDARALRRGVASPPRRARPPGRTARRRPAALALRARSARRRHHHYATKQPQPPPLTAGGPMNGVRSRPPRDP